MVASGSMEPTIKIGQRVLLDGEVESLRVGEIALFHPPEGAERQLCGAPQPPGSVCDRPRSEESSVNFVKRIVAGPGTCCSSRTATST